MRPGVVAVARLAQVSPSTVSNTFNRPDSVSPLLRQRVMAAADRLGYQGGDPTARNLRTGRLGTIGVVLRERLAYSFDDPAAVAVLQGLSDATDPHQFSLVILPAYPGDGSSVVPAVRRAAVDGLVLYSLTGDDPLMAATLQRGLPTVAVDSPLRLDAASPGPPPGTPGLLGEHHVVGIDEIAAARGATAHLLDLGHCRLGIISSRLDAAAEPGPVDAQRRGHVVADVARGRLEGVHTAVAAAGLSFDQVPVVAASTSSVPEGRRAMATLLDLDPSITAVFAFSDLMAAGARQLLGERGLSVPADVSLVGFDNCLGAGSDLTTVAQPLREKGRVATEVLLRLIAGDETTPRSTVLPTHLVVRTSTAQLG